MLREILRVSDRGIVSASQTVLIDRDLHEPVEAYLQVSRGRSGRRQAAFSLPTASVLLAFVGDPEATSSVLIYRSRLFRRCGRPGFHCVAKSETWIWFEIAAVLSPGPDLCLHLALHLGLRPLPGSGLGPPSRPIQMCHCHSSACPHVAAVLSPGPDLCLHLALHLELRPLPGSSLGLPSTSIQMCHCQASAWCPHEYRSI